MSIYANDKEIEADIFETGCVIHKRVWEDIFMEKKILWRFVYCYGK